MTIAQGHFDEGDGAEYWNIAQDVCCVRKDFSSMPLLSIATGTVASGRISAQVFLSAGNEDNKCSDGQALQG